MIGQRTAWSLAIILLSFGDHACATELTPAEKQLVTELKEEVSRIRQEIEEAKKDDAAYTGGLIKSLIAVRLELLRTNEALVEQRIHAVESGAKIAVVVNSSKPDPTRAADLAKEIETQKAKVAEARAQADQYSGGLIQALSESTVATARNSLAMLEQQYFIAKYGLSLPAAAPADQATSKTELAVTTSAKATAPTAKGAAAAGAGDCLKIASFDSSVLDSNDVYTELAWKIDVDNSCSEPFGVRVTFTIYDKDEFELDSDSEEVYVPAQGRGKARGKMLVSPPEKARRMARQGASLALR